MTLGGLLGGAGHWKDQAMIRSLKLSTPAPILWREDRGWEMELIIDHAYVIKSPQKSQEYMVLGASRLVNTSTPGG